MRQSGQIELFPWAEQHLQTEFVSRTDQYLESELGRWSDGRAEAGLSACAGIPAEPGADPDSNADNGSGANRPAPITLVDVSSAPVTLVSIVVLLRALTIAAAMCVLAALAVAVLGRVAVLQRRHGRVARIAANVGIAAAAIVLLMGSGHGSQGSGKMKSPVGTQPILPAPTMARYPLDEAATAVAAGAGDQLMVAEDANVALINVHDPRDEPATIPFYRQVSYVAADGADMTAVGAGWMTTGVLKNGVLTDRRYWSFGTKPGPAAVAFGAAFAANSTKEKVDRMTIANGIERPLPVPGSPTAVTSGDGFVWATVDDPADSCGWVYQFNPDGSLDRRYRIPADPSAIVVAFGLVWVVIDDQRQLLRYTLAGDRIGRAIPVAGGTDTLSVGAHYVESSSSTNDIVQRIDPRRGKVVGNHHLDEQPVGIVQMDGDTFAASGAYRILDVLNDHGLRGSV